MTLHNKAVLNDIPPLPGVYRFIADNNNVLYVGKASNLKKRVSSYFHKTRMPPRIKLILQKLHNIEVTVTASEHAALLLENNLIKELQPKYNILFRDDKSYPFLKLSEHPYPRVMFARGNSDGHSFGPFPDSKAVRESINMLQRVFHLRTCADSVFANRSRPCILHSIGRCSAPCVNLVSPAQYAADVKGAKTLLSGDSRGVEADLRAKMETASKQQEFETAAILRDRLRALAVMRARHFVDDPGSPDTDYAGAFSDDCGGCVNVVMVRGGRRLGERRFFPAHAAHTSPGELLSAFISQHYGGMKNPPRIVPSHRLTPALPAPLKVAALRGALQRRAEEAAHNARIAWELKQSQSTAAAEKVRALGERLDIPPPSRIECFDISHSMGEEPMAARAVFIDGAPAPSHYRRYAISAAGGNDTAAIAEAVGRACRRALEEDLPLPDLLMIDGGETQLRAAQSAMQKTGTEMPLLAISKGPKRKAGREKLITGEGEIIHLPETDPAFHLIQAVRDEAHRFAVDGHRRRRDKKRRTSALEDIDGVGTKLRRQLISYFGGMRGVKAAGEDELIKIKGVSPRLAKRIYHSLHE